jgi:N-acetylglucosaminyldiphosphoundecaprenol N-acetyl-beta-D-mannosaminyltransferase
MTLSSPSVLPNSSVKTALLFGWSIVAEPKQAWWQQVVLRLTSPAPQNAPPLTIFTPNPEIVVAAAHQPTFQATVAQADYLIPDGIGLVWASRWRQALGQSKQIIPERIAGTDVVAQLIDLAAQQNWRVLVIGGRDYLTGTNPAAQPAQHLAQLPGQVWWLPGYNHIAEPTGAEKNQVITELNRLKPTIVLVAFGAPHQEEWVIRHRLELTQAGVRLAMTVGGALDFLLGKVPRAPKAWQQLGLEWLYRLICQPWRIWRQLALIEFGWLTLLGR